MPSGLSLGSGRWPLPNWMRRLIEVRLLDASSPRQLCSFYTGLHFSGAFVAAA